MSKYLCGGRTFTGMERAAAYADKMYRTTGVILGIEPLPSYRPRRAAKRWLEDAPEYVLDVFDAGEKWADRYTVLFGGSLLDPHLLKDRKVHYLGMSAYPSHPQGVSMWGEVEAAYRPSHQRIRWLDLPENVRKHVIARAEGK